MEALSPTMEEGTLVKWLKNEGDAVKTGDTLAEVETDKAIMELVARGDGILRKRLGNEGDASPVGTLLAVIAGAEENIDALVAGAGGDKGAKPVASAPAAPSGETKAGDDATPVPAVPSESQGDASVPLQETNPPATAASAGEAPSRESPQAKRGSPPPARELPSESTDDPASGPASPAAVVATGGRQRTSPLARRLASERGVELGRIQGSGPGGRIIKRDIESAAAAPPPAARGDTSPGGVDPDGRDAAPPAPPLPSPPSPPPPRFISLEGDYQDIPLTQIRKTIARRLTESIGPVPTFYLTAEFDAERAAELRIQLKELGDEYKVSFNDIVIKAVATALAEHPEVNAHWMGDHVRHFNRVHVAMAVAIPEGLITPVVFDADRKTLSEISSEAKQLAELARQRRLTPEQYSGSTFSVSNLGMFGIDHFTAIINPPEAGILAIGAVEAKAVVVDGRVTARQRMRVTMSCDHRVIDGATGAKFLQAVRRLVENPLLLVL